jgi:hypothetical protein
MITTIQEAVRFADQNGLLHLSDAQIANEAFAQCWIDRVAAVQMASCRMNAKALSDASIETYHSAVQEANRYSKII